MNAQDEAVGAAAAPPKPDPMQNIVIVKLQELAAHTADSKKDAIELAKFLSKPLGKSHLRVLLDTLDNYYKEGDEKNFMEKLKLLRKEVQGPMPVSRKDMDLVTVHRDDLRLICFEYIS